MTKFFEEENTKSKKKKKNRRCNITLKINIKFNIRQHSNGTKFMIETENHFILTLV